MTGNSPVLAHLYVSSMRLDATTYLRNEVVVLDAERRHVHRESNDSRCARVDLRRQEIRVEVLHVGIVAFVDHLKLCAHFTVAENGVSSIKAINFSAKIK